MSNDKLIDYKIEKLEEITKSTSDSLQEIKECVIRMEDKLNKIPSTFSCPIHALRLETLEKKVIENSKDIGKTKTFVAMVSGALVIISIIIQLAGPLALDYLKPKHEDNNKITRTSLLTINTNGVVIK